MVSKEVLDIVRALKPSTGLEVKYTAFYRQLKDLDEYIKNGSVQAVVDKQWLFANASSFGMCDGERDHYASEILKLEEIKKTLLRK